MAIRTSLEQRLLHTDDVSPLREVALPEPLEEAAMRLQWLSAFERTVYADLLAIALLFVMLAILWTAGAI